MRKSSLFNVILLLIMALGAGTGMAQTTGRSTISIDFGPNNQTTPAPWNNVTNTETGSVANLLNDQGNPTGISISVTDRFNSWNLNGVTAHDSLGIPYSASRESFYGNTVLFNNATVPFSSVTVSNLDPAKAYSFAFFAARADVNDNRETLYTVTGLTTGTTTLNATRNTSRMARVSNIRPNVDGTITIRVEPGPNNNNGNKFFYLSAMKISYADEREPKLVTVLAPNGGGELKAGKDAAITWASTDVASVNIDYSVDNGANWQSVATSVPGMSRTYKWTVPAVSTERALVRVTDSSDPSLSDVSNQPFTIFQGTNGKSYTIVILGSSTAAGAGPTVRDSAWVWRYTNYLSHKRSEFNVINLAVGGYSTANIIPSGNPDHNITKALSLAPDAIIINMPSNDAAVGRSVEAQMANYDQIEQLATQANVPLWVTTPQPRNFSQDKVQIQLDMIDATYAKFGQTFTVDFWTGFNTEQNTMKAMYDSGDGVHMNSAAHRIMLERIIGENISGYLENTTLSSSKEITGILKVYPNPANSTVIISANTGCRIEKVQLVNMSGVKVLEKTAVNGTLEKLDVSAFAKGVYYLQLYTNKGLFYSKLVVQ